MVPMEVPHHLIGKPVSELNVPGEIAVAAIIRMGKAMIPVSGTRLRSKIKCTCWCMSPRSRSFRK